MINTLKIYEELAQTMEDAAARRLASVLGLIYEDLQNTVTKVEFNELRGTVRELAEAQQRTEQRMGELVGAQQQTGQRMDTLGMRMEELAETQNQTGQRMDKLAASMDRLAEAQQRTEQRMEELAEAQQRTEQRMEELAEAQQRTEQRVDVLGTRMAELAEAQQRTEQRVDVLGIRMAELAEAQQRTEQRVDVLGTRMAELAEAQQRTEQRMEELAEAQKQTTQILASLSRAHDNTRQQVGGLSRTMAYALENEAYRLLPAFLKTQHQIEVRERLIRAWVNGEEINFYARARRDGEDVVIVGESVMRLDDGAKFGQLQRQLEAVRAVEALPLVPLLVTHFARPDLLEQARQQGIVVVQSFEWG